MVAMPAPPTPLPILHRQDSSPVIGDCPDISLSPPPHTPQDDKLTSWLRSLNCDTETIGRFADEEYTKSDVLEFVSRDDLRRMGLK